MIIQRRPIPISMTRKIPVPDLTRLFRKCACASAAALVVFSAACAPVSEPEIHEPEIRKPEVVMEKVDMCPPFFEDHFPFETLASALEKNRAYLDRLPPDHLFRYGEKTFSPYHIKQSQKLILELIRQNPDPADLTEAIERNFDIFKAAGGRSGKVLFTGYYEPVYKASLSPDENFRYPIYSPPSDMVRIDPGLFNPDFKNDHLVARIEGSKAIPYYSRYQIETEKALEGRGIELAWLEDPVDVAFLHIQGSGRLELPDGRIISAGYAARNGHPYRSIGAYLIKKGAIAREDMSMQAIRGYLASNPGRIETVLNYNPSYIFFRIHDGPAVGNIGVPLTPMRSIALDVDIFPGGALGFISAKRPRLNVDGLIEEWEPFSAFIVNQDTGSAIKGPGRADIFWGGGRYAETAAGHLRHEGDLYLLVKKP